MRKPYSRRVPPAGYDPGYTDQEHANIEQAIRSSQPDTGSVGRYLWLAVPPDFRDANGVSPQVDTVYPEWWGGTSGTGLAGAADCSPALQAATRCGIRRTLYGEGTYKHLSTVRIAEIPTSPADIIIEGISKTASILQAGQAVLGAPINAFIINQQNNGKLTCRHIRFSGQNGVSAFTGYAIYALEDSTNSQAIFSGQFDDLWIAMGVSPAGFFKGGLSNFFATRLICEGTNTRFTLVGSGVSDVHFDLISDYSCTGPLVDMSQDTLEKNIVSISNVHAYQPQSGVLFPANNARSLTLEKVIYQVNDPAIPGTGLGLAYLVNCKDFLIANSQAMRYPAMTANMDKVIRIDGGNGEINGQKIDGGDMCLAVQGAVDITINGGNFKNAVSHILAFTGVTSGTVRLKGATLQYAGLALIKTLVAGCSVNLEIDDCEILDSGYNAGAPHSAIEVETSGSVLINGKRLGRTAGATSNMNGVLLLTGSGNARVRVEELVGTAPLVDPASTQIPVIELTGTGSPETVHMASPGSIFHRTNGGALTSLYVKETGTGNTGWVGK